jgi:hypothetical protein
MLLVRNNFNDKNDDNNRAKYLFTSMAQKWQMLAKATK